MKENATAATTATARPTNVARNASAAPTANAPAPKNAATQAAQKWRAIAKTEVTHDKNSFPQKKYFRIIHIIRIRNYYILEII